MSFGDLFSFIKPSQLIPKGEEEAALDALRAVNQSFSSCLFQENVILAINPDNQIHLWNLNNIMGSQKSERNLDQKSDDPWPSNCSHHLKTSSSSVDQSTPRSTVSRRSNQLCSLSSSSTASFVASSSDSRLHFLRSLDEADSIESLYSIQPFSSTTATGQTEINAICHNDHFSELYIGSSGAGVAVFPSDVEAKKPSAVYAQKSGPIHSLVKFSHGFAAGTEQGTVEIYDVRQAERVKLIEPPALKEAAGGGSSKRITALDSDNDWLLIGTSSKSIYQYHLSKTIIHSNSIHLASSGAAGGGVGGGGERGGAASSSRAGLPPPSKRKKSSSNSPSAGSVTCLRYTPNGVFCSGDFPCVKSFSRSLSEQATLSLDMHQSSCISFNSSFSALSIAGSSPFIYVYLEPFAQKSFSLSAGDSKR